MIIGLYRKLQAKKNEKSFRMKSCIGKNITLQGNLGSVNTGAKEYIKIGDHGFVGGIFQVLCGGKIEVGNNILMKS